MLVDYSDSESDTQQEQKQQAKRRKVEHVSSRAPPPLPTTFHTLYTTNVRNAAADDPSLHGGRSRQVPHIQGNWPTHVYLEWLPSKDRTSEIEDIITKLQNLDPNHSSINSFLRSDLHVQQPLHVSLSAPLVIRTEQKDEFRDSLVQSVKTCDARAFKVSPNRLAWVANVEGSRYFLVLSLTRPRNDDLNKLLNACNACAEAWDMNTLYGNGKQSQIAPDSAEIDQDRSSSLHISVAWTLERPSEIQERGAETETFDQTSEATIGFSSVRVKVGNVVTEVPLGTI